MCFNVFNVWSEGGGSWKKQIRDDLKSMLEKHRDAIRHFQFWVEFPERAPEEAVKFEEIICIEVE